MASAERPLIIGRYTLAAPVGAGGMATIYLGRQAGAAGFSRVVAVKRLHPHYASEPEFIAMFLDEARLAARVRHAHVVETLDVVHEGSETVIVLEYVDGESLSGLNKSLHAAGERMPLPIASRIMMEVCRGLHAAHEAMSTDGRPLGIVHRDVSPQNVLVGSDGSSRVTDFGIALASGRLSHTKSGQVKGKPAYMAPEQLAGAELTRKSDLYAAGVVLWELCAGRRAYEAQNEGALYARVLAGAIPRLDEVAPWVPPALGAVVERALQRDPARRFASGHEMALAIEHASTIAASREVGAFVETHARAALATRRALASTLDLGATPPPPSSVAPMLDAKAPLASRSSRPPAMRDDTQRRITHTLTAASPSPKRGVRISLVAVMVAVIGAALLGGGGVWLVTRKPSEPRPASPATAPEPAKQDDFPPIASASSVATASVATAPNNVEPEPDATAPNTDAPLPSLTPPGSDRLQPRRSATSVSSSSKCDPPYFVDAQGIRRVKRECF